MTAAPATALDFAAAARRVAQAAAAHGLRIPAFRSPPRGAGVVRTVRHRPDGGAVVAVAFRGRPAAAVAADLVEGVLVVNGLVAATPEGLRADLLAAALGGGEVQAA